MLSHRLQSISGNALDLTAKAWTFNSEIQKKKFYVVIKSPVQFRVHSIVRIFNVSSVQVQLYKAYLKYKQLKKQGQDLVKKMH